MNNTKKHKVRRCGSCALLGGVKTGCPSPSALASYAACTTHFEANDTCRIADALEDLPPVVALLAVHAQVCSIAQVARASGKVFPVEKLETLSRDFGADMVKEIAEMYDVCMEAKPDLSRLEQELRGLVTSAGVQRTEGREDEADRYERKAEVVRRCIAVMRGEVAPLEVEL